jgi:hypothetical protein
MYIKYIKKDYYSLIVIKIVQLSFKYVRKELSL